MQTKIPVSQWRYDTIKAIAEGPDDNPYKAAAKEWLNYIYPSPLGSDFKSPEVWGNG